MLGLVELGVSVNWKDSKHRIPLHYACNIGNIDIISFLIESGSEKNIKDTHDMTPYELGVKHGHRDIDHLFLISN